MRRWWSQSLPFAIMPFQRWGLWARLTSVLTVGFLLLFGIFSLLSLQTINDSTEHILQERLVIAEMAALEVDGLFNRAFYELQKATDFAPFDPQSSNLGDEIHILAHAYGRIGTLSLGVAFLDGAGRVVLTEPTNLSPAGADWSARPYIHAALTTGRRQISTPFTDPNTGRPAVAIALPLPDEIGQVNSLLVGLIDLSTPEIQAPLQKARRLGSSGWALVIDEDGLIVASTTPEQFSLPGEHRAFYRRMLAARRPAIENVPTGSAPEHPHVIAFAPLETTPWGVAVGSDTAETLAPVRRLRNGILLLGTLSLLTVLIATVLGTQRLVRPVKDLTRAARHIANGNLNHPITIDEGGEIGQLAAAFEHMRQDLATERHRLQDLAILKERDRLAREMHDGFAQALGVLNLNAKAARQATAVGDAAQVTQALDALDQIIDQAYADVREAISGLRTPVPHEQGLVAVVSRYLEEFGLQYGFATEFEAEGTEDISFTVTQEIQLLRIIQEALSNTRKHATAGRAQVRFQRVEDQVRITIADDGLGFDPAAMAQSAKRTFGLAIMRERAESLSGLFRLDACPGGGTMVTVLIPLGEKDER